MYRLDRIEKQGRIIRAILVSSTKKPKRTITWNLKPGESVEDRKEQINQAIERELEERNAGSKELPTPIDVTEKVRGPKPKPKEGR
jgi:hypothetical protein